MLDRFRRFLTPPRFQDEATTRTARLLNIVLWTLLVLAVLSGLAAIATNLGQPGKLVAGVLVSVLFAAPAVAGQSLMRSGRVRLTSMLLIGLLKIYLIKRILI